MRKRSIILAVIAVVTVGITVWLTMRTSVPDPVYEGRHLSEWVNKAKVFYVGESFDRYSVAILSLSGEKPFSYRDFPELDTNALPYLRKALEARNGPFHQKYKAAWAKAPGWLQRRLPKPVEAVQVRRVAALLLGSFGTSAKSSVPKLVRLVEEDDDINVRQSAAFSLLFAGEDTPSVRQALTNALNDGNPALNETAHMVLNNLRQIAASTNAPKMEKHWGTGIRQ